MRCAIRAGLTQQNPNGGKAGLAMATLHCVWLFGACSLVRRCNEHRVRRSRPEIRRPTLVPDV